MTNTADRRNWLNRFDSSPTRRQRRQDGITLTFNDHGKRAAIALGIAFAASHHPATIGGALVSYGAALQELFSMVKKQP